MTTTATLQPEDEASEKWVRYLLDDIAEDERQRIEDAAFTDDAVASAIDAALTDALDMHAAGELPPNRAKAMDERIARSAELRRRFAFAQALRRRARARSAVTVPLASRSRRILAPLALAATFVLVAGGLATKYAGEAGPQVVASVDLEPATRGAAFVPTLVVPQGTAGVVIARLTLPHAAPGKFVAEVSAAGGVSFRSGELSPGNDGRLEVAIPASALAGSRATISVFAAGAAEAPIAFFELVVEHAPTKMR